MPAANSFYSFLRALSSKLRTVLLLGRKGRDPDYLLSEALKLQHLNKSEEALSLYSKALALSPSNLIALHNRADLYKETGRFKEALEDYALGVSLRLNINPDHPDTLSYRGLYYNFTDRHEEALVDLNRALLVNDKHEEALRYRAISFFCLNYFEEALNDLNRVYELNPQVPGLLDMRAKVFLRLNLVQEAIRDIFLIYGVKPSDTNDTNHQQRVLTAFHNYGLFTQALEVSTSLLILQPDNPDYLMCRAYELQMLDQHMEALGELDRAIILKSDSDQLHARKGSLLYYLGRLEEALDSLNNSLGINPENLLALSMRSRIRLRSGQIHAGGWDLAKARSIGFDVPIVRCTGAALLSITGNTQAAISIVSDIIRYLPWTQREIVQDPLFNNLHTLPEWQALIANKALA